MELDTKESIMKAKSMVLENYNLQMVVIIMDNLNKMRFVEKEHILGQMERNIQVIGRRIKCMEKEHCTGKMEKYTWEIS